MIHARLNELEKNLCNNGKDSLYKLKTLEKFKEWMKQVDHRAEIIPIDSVARLNNLLVSLKGDILAIDELELVEEIVIEHE